ncbi:MAG: tetratricopeptide repeat protein [Candidatus Bathyarchaeota archaeon]|nr:tetratricopeptide repeat protein [Candidatus Bathyarchaeota archaeon]
MYERFQPSDRVFVNREEYLDWMSEALERCKEQSVVLHLRGIGGIGKSSLLDHWKSTIDDTIRLDCEQYTDFYARLNVIAKGAVLLGVNLQRFDVLWQIRQRFVEGVEPVKEKGRERAKEVVMAIPFIGSLASIGSAIGAIGATVSPKLRGRYGNLGEWLQTRLGKDYVQRLLETLWKEPRHAEFLYLDALLEDLNSRKTSEKPIVFLFDHSEHVDNERCRWHYGGREITETELWYVFLSSLSNCVGVIASRQAMPSQTSGELEIEESELTELDRESCIELLDQRQVTDRELQERIVSVSGGNPFVIGALCDAAESGSFSLKDVENLRADTLEAVRLKTWRRLFTQAQDLLRLVEKAGLVPFFDRGTMSIIAPDMRTDHWDRLIHLSFVRNRGDGTWVLHDLARELIVAELGQRLQDSTNEVVELLDRASADESDYALLGLALSVRALVGEREAAAKLGSVVSDLLYRNNFSDALTLLNAVKIDTKGGQAVIKGLRGGVLAYMARVADGEQAFRESLETFQEFDESIPDELMVHKARTLHFFGLLLRSTGRSLEAEESFQESLEVYRSLDENTLGFRPQDMATTFQSLGYGLMRVHRHQEAEKAYREAHQLFEQSTSTTSYDPMIGITLSLRSIGMTLFFTGRPIESEEIQRNALEIYRKHASERLDDASFLRHLCFCLGTLADTLRLMNRPYEAIDLYQEAIQVARELAKKEPEALSFIFPFMLAGSALPLRQTGEYSEAEEAYLEGVSEFTELAEKTPDVFSKLLAAILLDFAVLLRQTGRVSEAEEKCREALRIHRELAAKEPGQHDYQLPWNLNNLAVLLRKAGRAAEAEETYREALHTARRTSQEAPEAIFLVEPIATILNNLAVLFRKAGRTTEAEEAILEALEIRRQLAQKSPELFLYRVATTLNNLGVLLAESGKTSDAEGALREALQLRRDLVYKSSGLYQPYVGSTLNNLGILLKRTGRTSESENAYREAIEIGEELVLRAPMVYQHELMKTLCNYALLLSDINGKDALKKIMTRLEGLGIQSLPESEEWSEEEEEEAFPPGAV